MPGVLEWQTFRSPVPQFPFLHPDGRGEAKPKAKSIWMYPTERPEKGTVGRTMTQPEAQHLPLLESSDPAGAAIPLAKVLTIASSGEESEDNDVGGMDLDDPEAKDSSTSSIVVDGLPKGSSTSSFYEMTRSTFFHAGVTPVKVVWQSGRMWVSMRNAREGQYAMGALAALKGDRHISFVEEESCNYAIQSSSDVWTSSGALSESVDPIPMTIVDSEGQLGSSRAIATTPSRESLDALQVMVPTEGTPPTMAPSVQASEEATSERSAWASADTPREGLLEAPPLLAETLMMPSAPSPVPAPSPDLAVAQQISDEGIFRLFAPSLRALTRKPSSPVRQPPTAPRAMRSTIPMAAPLLPAPVVQPAFLSRMADPVPFWTRIGPSTKHAIPRRTPSPLRRPVLLNCMSDGPPIALLSRFSTPPPVDGPALIHRMGDLAPGTAPSAKRPRSPSPPPKASAASSSQPVMPKKAARCGMRGGEMARQLRLRKVERARREAALAGGLPESPVEAEASSSVAPREASSSAAPSVVSRPVRATPQRAISQHGRASIAGPSLAERLLPVGASTVTCTSRAASVAGLPPVATSELDQALMEVDWTLARAERAAPLDRMDWDMEDKAPAWNDPSM